MFVYFLEQLNLQQHVSDRVLQQILNLLETPTVGHMKIIPRLSGKWSYQSMYLHVKSILTQKFISKAAGGHILPQLGLLLCAKEGNFRKMLKYFPQNNHQVQIYLLAQVFPKTEAAFNNSKCLSFRFWVFSFLWAMVRFWKGPEVLDIFFFFF